MPRTAGKGRPAPAPLRAAPRPKPRPRASPRLASPHSQVAAWARAMASASSGRHRGLIATGGGRDCTAAALRGRARLWGREGGAAARRGEAGPCPGSAALRERHQGAGDSAAGARAGRARPAPRREAAAADTQRWQPQRERRARTGQGVQRGRTEWAGSAHSCRVAPMVAESLPVASGSPRSLRDPPAPPVFTPGRRRGTGVRIPAADWLILRRRRASRPLLLVGRGPAPGRVRTRH